MGDCLAAPAPAENRSDGLLDPVSALAHQLDREVDSAVRPQGECL